MTFENKDIGIYRNIQDEVEKVKEEINEILMLAKDCNSKKNEGRIKEKLYQLKNQKREQLLKLQKLEDEAKIENLKNENSLLEKQKEIEKTMEKEMKSNIERKKTLLEENRKIRENKKKYQEESAAIDKQLNSDL